MLRPELELLADRYVPGGGKIEIRALGRGLVYETYRVLRDGKAHALRVAAERWPKFGVDCVWESQVLQNAGAAGIAPALEYCDPERGILVTRWVDGLSWSADDARRPSNLARMAALLRHVHALPVPVPPRLITPAGWIARYSMPARDDEAGARHGGAAGHGTSAGHGTAKFVATASSRAAALRGEADLRLASLAALPAVAPVVCHSDLHGLNVIDRGESLILLDWEYAHAAEPLWDLAGWSANNDLEEPLRHELLRRYLERTPTQEDQTRFSVLIWLYDYVCWLWSALYLESGRLDVGTADAAHAGVAARAQWLEARLTGRHPA